MPRMVGQAGLGTDHVADRDARGTGCRTACRRPDAATPGRSSPGSRRARWRRRRTTGRCRSPCPGRSRSSHHPSRRMAVPHRPGGVAVAGPRVAEQHGVAGAVVERAPGLVGDGHVVEGHSAIERERSVAGNCDELAMAGIVAGTPRARDREGCAMPFVPSSCRCAPDTCDVRARAEASLPCSAGHIPARRQEGTVGLPPRLPDRDGRTPSSLVMRTSLLYRRSPLPTCSFDPGRCPATGSGGLTGATN